MQSYLIDVNNINQTSQWIDLSIIIGKCTKHLKDRKKEEIQNNLIELVYHVFSIAKKHNIDMNQSWSRWLHKTDYKIYY